MHTRAYRRRHDATLRRLLRHAALVLFTPYADIRAYDCLATPCHVTRCYAADKMRIMEYIYADVITSPIAFTIDAVVGFAFSRRQPIFMPCRFEPYV